MIRQLILGTLFTVAPAALTAAEPIGVTKLTVSYKRDRLAEVLSIRQATATFTSAEPFTHAKVRIDCYRNGQKVRSFVALSVGHNAGQTSADISIQTVDLDVLALGPPKPGFTRLFCNIETHGEGVPLFSAQTHDLAKATFEAHSVAGSSTFIDRSVYEGAIPLFYTLSRTRTVASATGPAQLLAANPKADIMMVSIVLTGSEE